MSEVIRLKVADARQLDIGYGRVRIHNEIMHKLGITEGDFVEIHGKRPTVAVAWPAYTQDQDQEMIRMDGLIQRNAGTMLGQVVEVRKAEVMAAQKITFAPTDVRLSVDEEFIEFVERRFMNMPFMGGDMVPLSLFGTAVPLEVIATQPRGAVKITEATAVHVRSEPIQALPKGPDSKKLRRKAWLMDVMEKTRAEAIKFVIPGGGEWNEEDPALDEARKVALEKCEPVMIYVRLLSEKGPIKLDELFEYARVYEKGPPEYIYKWIPQDS